MDDARKISVKNGVFRALSAARDQYQSAGILYESKKYHASLPFLRDAVMYGIKALLMLDHDDLPDDSGLVDAYYQADVSQDLKLSIELKGILKRLENVQEEKVGYPSVMSRESLKDMATSYKQTGIFLAKARRYINKSLQTTQEMKKKKIARKLMVAGAATILAVLVIIRLIIFITTFDNGLMGSYYSGLNFETLIKEQRDKMINFDWNMGSIIDDYFDNVSVRWTGRIKTPVNAEYIFITRSDDGARLWIDGRLIIDDWNIHAVMDKRAAVYLDKGFHDIRVEYFDSGGQAVMKLMWLVPGWRSQKAISPNYLKLAND